MSGQRLTALVTGASVGIGRDLAHVLAEHGHDLVLTARNEAQLQSLAEELQNKFGAKVNVIVKDLASPQAAPEIVEELSARRIRIDLLINNAGFGALGRFDRMPEKQVLQMLQVNVVALTQLARLLIPAMVQRRSGRVMNVASTAAFQPGPLMAEYYASKAYVLSFSEAIAAELKHTGVTVTALCPGPTLTEFQKRAGVQNSRLFDRGSMDSMSVARIGYAAMMRGQRVAITGWRNKMLVQAVRFMPRAATLAIVKRLNQNR
jgi:uncharacterized protein